MEPINYFNQSLEEKANSGWSNVRKKAATGMAFLMLSGASIGVMNKPSYAKPIAGPEISAISNSEEDQESVWDRITGVFKKKKKEEAKKPAPARPQANKPKSTATSNQQKSASQATTKPSQSTLDDYIIKPIEVIVGDEAPKYLRHGERIVIPYGQTFSVTPQTNKQGMRTEFLLKLPYSRAVLNDKFQTDDKGYLSNRFGERIVFMYGQINPGELGIKEGVIIKGQITYENPTRVFNTGEIEIEVGKPVEPTVTLAPPYIREEPTEETKIAQKMLDKEAKKMVPVKPKKPHEQRQAGESLFSFKVVYVQGNTLSLIENDTETADKTGKGWVFEGLFARPTYQVWANHLSYTDDCRLPVFGGNLRHVTSQFDVGIEAKVLGIIALGGEFFNYNLKWETDWPDTTRTWSPDMEKYQSNGFKVGAGLVLGEYNKSFIEGLYYIGKGKAIESKINPSLEYYGEYITDTESFTEKSLKIHARAELGPFLLKGNYIKGKYDNSAKTLDGDSTMYNADALLNLSELVPRLGQGKMDINAGLFYHHIEVSEVGLELFEHELYGPIVIMNFKW